MQLATNKGSHDLILKEGGGVLRCDKGRYTVQLVQSRLRTLLGEWVLDDSIGFINFTDLKKNYSQNELEQRATEIIVSTTGVLELLTMTLTLKRTRDLVIDFKARTIFGDIDTTVPWTDEDVIGNTDILPQVDKSVVHNGIQVTHLAEPIIHS